jgi:hypothetical protein
MEGRSGKTKVTINGVFQLRRYGSRRERVGAIYLRGNGGETKRRPLLHGGGSRRHLGRQLHWPKVVARLCSGRKTTLWWASMGHATMKPPGLSWSIKKAEALLGRCGMGRGKEAGCTTSWAKSRIRTGDNF